MASLKSLKMDLKMLKETFSKDHERFQITQAATDQLSCRFIGENGKKFDIHANIPDDYPSEPLLWYTDSDDTNIEEIVENLSSLHQDKPILNQVDILLRELCRLHNMKVPNDAAKLLIGESSSASTSASTSGNAIDNASEDASKSRSVKPLEGLINQSTDEQNEDGYGSDTSVSSLDSDNFESATALEKSPSKKSSDDAPPLKKAHMDVLKKLQSDSSSSNAATSRLMKEMMEIYRSASYKNGDYTIELVDDSIYNWNIELRCIDNDSELYTDLIKLKKKEGKDCIVINITFNDKYPIEPPFVRVVYPIVKCIHVTIGGAFCTALLLKQCWSPAYTIESVIVQMAALLVKGNARICFDSPIKYSLSAARNTFDGVMSRKQTGWYDQYKESS